MSPILLDVTGNVTDDLAVKLGAIEPPSVCACCKSINLRNLPAEPISRGFFVDDNHEIE